LIADFCSVVLQVFLQVKKRTIGTDLCTVIGNVSKKIAPVISASMDVSMVLGCKSHVTNSYKIKTQNKPPPIRPLLNCSFWLIVVLALLISINKTVLKNNAIPPPTVGYLINAQN
jgi:hypothetical protein